MSKSLITKAAAVAAVSIVAVAGPASAAMNSVTKTPTKYVTAGTAVKVIWQDFAGATDVQHTIVQAADKVVDGEVAWVNPFTTVRTITGAETGLLTVTCDFTRADGVTVKRAFNNTVALDDMSRINWGDNRRDNCDVVTEVALTVPVLKDQDGDDKVTTTGPMDQRDAYHATQALIEADPNLRITVRADF